MWYEILRPFVNGLTADDKYSGTNMQIYRNNFKRHYLGNKKLFLDFLLHFWNVQIQSIFEKKMSILA